MSMQQPANRYRLNLKFDTDMDNATFTFTFSHCYLSPIHTADADATKLFCRVASASAVCT